MEKLKNYVLSLVLMFICLPSEKHVMGCLESDRKALFYFKNGLEDPENRLGSWRGDDCCRWRGVRCDNVTRAVIAIDLHNPYPNSFNSAVSIRYGFWNLSGKIDPALLRLKSLRYLDLSLNTFQGIPIPEFFGSLLELQYLNLSKAGFGGMIPHYLGNISNLPYLDVSSEFPPLKVDNLQWVSSLSSLRHLGMNNVDLSMVNSNSVRVLNMLPFLTELHLSGCGLSGLIPSLRSNNLISLAVIDLSFNGFDSKFPDWVVNMSTLVSLDISNSGLHGSIPLSVSELPNLGNLNLAGNNDLTVDCSKLLKGSWRRIEVLGLASNNMYGKLPTSIGKMTLLIDLDLSDNNVEGEIPNSIGNLCYLKNLNLGSNNLSGELPKFLYGIKSCFSVNLLSSLMYLRLSNNHLVGNLPDWLGQLENLEELGLDYNLLQGPIPSSLGKLSLLKDLGLGGNDLNGTIPDSLGQLSNLVVFDVRNLDMGSCNLGPSFPSWLESQKEVRYLDFSNASISGPIPSWFWDLSSNLSLLNVSLNRLQGQLPNPFNIAPFADVDFSFNLLQGPIPLPLFEVELLDLSDNKFSGPVPLNIGNILPNLIFFSLSRNHVTGGIPTSIGEMILLEVLDLSENNLTAEIPSSLDKCSLLKVIDFNENNLSGVIPWSFGQLKQLQTLRLSNNRLSGELPSSLQNCSSLETLDVGNNKFSGNIPLWIGQSLTSLRILRLRSNTFSGLLPPQITNLSLLQVLDLAEKILVGNIPDSLRNLEAMADMQNVIKYRFYGKYRGVYYEESVVVFTKGQPLKYTKLLSLITSIDLSGNNFDGNFPEAITSLRGLVVLNLSRNLLAGHSPEEISDLHELASLDVSSNKLSGPIPSTMSSMSSMEYLNLSNNNLFGMIPFTGQLTTFDESSYLGNPGL